MPRSDQPFAESRSALALFGLLVFLFHTLLTGGHLTSPDEELLFRQAESIALRGSTAVVPIEADLATGLLPAGFPDGATFATRTGREPGVFYAQYLPLQPLLAAPLVWAGRALEGSLADVYTAGLWPTITMEVLETLDPEARARAAFRRGLVVMLFNPLVAALSAVVLARVGKLLTGSRRAGLWAGGLWAFTTVAWPHSRTFFTEPLAGLITFLAVEMLIRWGMRPAGDRTLALLAGVFLALGNWTRVDGPFLTMGLWLAAAGFVTWRTLRASSRARLDTRFPRSDLVIIGGLPFAAWLALQAFNASRFGFDPTSGYGDQAEGVRFNLSPGGLYVGLHGLLFSTGKGMFWFSPGLLLGLWGWARVPAALRWVRTMMFVGYLPFFLAMALWQNWDGGWCWGPRHIVQVHLPIMLGAAFLYAPAATLATRVATTVLVLAGVSVQIYGSSQSPMDFYHEYFRTYRDYEYHRVNLTPLQQGAIRGQLAVRERRADGSEGGLLPLTEFPAPMIDSLYIPQHTQWASYGRMWRLGYRDWFWWIAVTGHEVPDRRGARP